MLTSRTDMGATAPLRAMLFFQQTLHDAVESPVSVGWLLWLAVASVFAGWLAGWL